MNIIKAIPPKPEVGSDVALDIEMFNLPDNKIHHPEYGDFACMTINMGTDDVYYIDKTEDIQEALDAVHDCRWIWHNGTFDITHLRRWAYIPGAIKLDWTDKQVRPIWDTYYMERVLWAGYFQAQGLNHLVRRYLNKFMEKETREHFSKATEMTDEMIHYACQDAIYTYQVAKKQMKIMKRRGEKYEKEVWEKIDEISFWSYMDIMPVRVDKDGWDAFSDENKAEFQRLADEMPVNPRSWQQVKKHLNDNGWDIPSTGDKVLRSWMRKDPESKNAKFSDDVLNARKMATRVSKYGRKWSKKNLTQLKDGNWYAVSNWDLNYAATSRPASRSPNLQNIPIRDTPRFREFFIARPGNVLVVSDWNQQEPKISAYLSQDKTLIKVFKQGGDVYANTASIRAGRKVDKSDPLRGVMKAIFLGLSYGQTKYGLADGLGIDVDEAEMFLNDFWEIFPEWYRYLEDLKSKFQRSKTSKNLPYSETIIGRKIWLNPYNYASERNVLNNPIQGTAAEMKKNALNRMWLEWEFDYPFAVILDIHDEINDDVPFEIAEKVVEFNEKIMIEEAEKLCPGIPFLVDSHIVDNWAEAKD